MTKIDYCWRQWGISSQTTGGGQWLRSRPLVIWRWGDMEVRWYPYPVVLCPSNCPCWWWVSTVGGCRCPCRCPLQRDTLGSLGRTRLSSHVNHQQCVLDWDCVPQLTQTQGRWVQHKQTNTRKTQQRQRKLTFDKKKHWRDGEWKSGNGWRDWRETLMT